MAKSCYVTYFLRVFGVHVHWALSLFRTSSTATLYPYLHHKRYVVNIASSLSKLNLTKTSVTHSTQFNVSETMIDFWTSSKFTPPPGANEIYIYILDFVGYMKDPNWIHFKAIGMD